MTIRQSVFRLLCTVGICVLFAVLSLNQPQAWGQAAAEPEPAAEAPAEPAAEPAETSDPNLGGDIKSLGGLIFKRPQSTADWAGAVFYLVLAVFSVFAVTITLERFINLNKAKFIPDGFAAQLKALVGSSLADKQSLESLAQSTSIPAGRILHAGLTRAGRSVPEVEKAMEDAANREIIGARSRIRPLKTIANTAPLVGLLGTVVGIMFAFQVSSQQGLGKGEALAEGIYLALLTTAGGLTIAIPCLLLVAFFNGKLERFFLQIDECLMETIPSFSKMEEDAITNRAEVVDSEQTEAVTAAVS